MIGVPVSDRRLEKISYLLGKINSLLGKMHSNRSFLLVNFYFAKISEVVNQTNGWQVKLDLNGLLSHWFSRPQKMTRRP